MTGYLFDSTDDNAEKETVDFLKSLASGGFVVLQRKEETEGSSLPEEVRQLFTERFREVKSKLTETEKKVVPLKGVQTVLRQNVLKVYEKNLRDYLDFCQKTASPDELIDICQVLNERIESIHETPTRVLIDQAKAYKVALETRKARLGDTPGVDKRQQEFDF